jgi:hypothetical protein
LDAADSTAGFCGIAIEKVIFFDINSHLFDLRRMIQALLAR